MQGSGKKGEGASGGSPVWQCAWRGPDLLGEGPLWHPDEKRLYWLDCIRPAIHRLDPATGKHAMWALPSPIGSIAPRSRGGLIAAMGVGIFFLRFEKKIAADDRKDLSSKDEEDGGEEVKAELVKEVIAGLKVRLNDGKCDRFGRFWFGSVASDFSNPDGTLYRLDPDGTLTEVEHHVKVSNGLGWSLDNKLMYYTDSLRNEIYCYDYDAATGNATNRRTFARIPESEGVPDGLTVDSEGFIWSAQWNGDRITRYFPDGKVERQITLPAHRPTSCMFGGENLDTLYVTSASRDVGEAESLVGEYQGALFAIKVQGVRGLAEHAYLG